MTSKIVILGSEFRNKGAEAMTRTLLSQFHDDDIIITSYYDSDVKMSHELGGSKKIIKHIGAIREIGKALLLLSRLEISEALQSLRDIPKIYTMTKHIQQADVVVDLGGYALTSDFGTVRIITWIEGLLLAKITNTPFIMLPQSVGPFRSWIDKQLVRRVLPYCDERYVRGSISKSYLEDLGVSDVIVKPDTAFLFEPTATDRTKQVVDEIDNSFVTIVPNARLDERWPQYQIEMAALIDYIICSTDQDILMLPHEYKPDGEYDDENVIRNILKHCSEETDSIHTVTDEYMATELKAILNESDLLIGSRLHSTVAATSMGVPTIALGWSRKYYEILEFFELEEYVWLPDNYNRNKLTSQINDILNGNSENKTKIINNLDTVIKQAKEPYDNIRTKYIKNDFS